MKIVGSPVWKWTLVERPPMSQRSHIASSGSTAIWRVLGRVQRAELDLGRQRRRAGELVGEHVPERLGREVLLRQVERDHVDHLVVGEPLALEGHHLLGDRDLAEGELDARPPPTGSSLWRRSASMKTSVSFFGCVYQSPSKGSTIARRPSTSSSRTS